MLDYTPVAAQVIFFGAVLSAIMSCSSATLLAPSVAFSENIVRGFYPQMRDHHFLWVMRVTIVCFAAVVLAFALSTNASIFKMVENAYKVTLAGAFVPLFAGALWKRANGQGALAAIFGGLFTWLLVEVLVGEASPVPPQLLGLAASCLGMVVGSLLPQWVGRPGHPAPPGPAVRRVPLRHGTRARRGAGAPDAAEAVAGHAPGCFRLPRVVRGLQVPPGPSPAAR